MSGVRAFRLESIQASIDPFLIPVPVSLSSRFFLTCIPLIIFDKKYFSQIISYLWHDLFLPFFLLEEQLLNNIEDNFLFLNI